MEHFFFSGAPKGDPKCIYQGRARPICLLGRNLYLIYFCLMYNLEGSWPHVRPQNSKKASAF
jgi:hypothetical protein